MLLLLKLINLFIFLLLNTYMFNLKECQIITLNKIYIQI